MSIRNPWQLGSEEITPKATYLNRRQILRSDGFGGRSAPRWELALSFGFSGRQRSGRNKIDHLSEKPFQHDRKAVHL